MACLVKFLDALWGTQQAQGVISPVKQNAVLPKVPDDILYLLFEWCSGSGEDLHNLSLTCKRFSQLTRNDIVDNKQGVKEHRNNRFWYKVLQLQTTLLLPNKTSFLNYKSLYTLFIVNCYPMREPGLLSGERQKKEYALHKRGDARCVGYSCSAKERAIFRSILHEANDAREEALKTIILMHSVFPLRTHWDEHGNEMRFCTDCRQLTLAPHGVDDGAGPNIVHCQTFWDKPSGDSYGMNF